MAIVGLIVPDLNRGRSVWSAVSVLPSRAAKRALRAYCGAEDPPDSPWLTELRGGVFALVFNRTRRSERRRVVRQGLWVGHDGDVHFDRFVSSRVLFF